MLNDLPSGPLGHSAIPAALAYIVGLNPIVAGFCGILPDLLDKPLSIVVDNVSGRYIGHSLLFIGLVAVAFLIWKRSYGLSAIIGGMSHLLLDLDGVPWFFPFKQYSWISEGESEWLATVKAYFQQGYWIDDLIGLAAAAVLVLVVICIRRMYRTRKTATPKAESQFDKLAGKKDRERT